MMRRCVILLGMLLICAGLVQADGVLIPGLPGAILPDQPYFTIKYHHVQAEIADRVCTTTVDQVFVNETRRELEATYLFPLPPGAVVQKFTLYADGEEIPAKLLSKEEAQRIYEEIVRKRRDPALLTYAGNNAYQARIYPIPAGGERRIEIAYTEVLSYDTGLVGYLYPLSTEKFSPKPLKDVLFTADIRSPQAIGSVYSPSHDLSVNRVSENRVKVSYEATNVTPDRDLLLYYSVAQDPIGLSLLTFKEKKQDGFFLLLAAPAVEQEAARALPKRLLFVIDTSGSMSGEKIKQAQGALTFCVNALNSQDSFNIIAFSDHLQEFGKGLAPAAEDKVKQARKFIEGLSAQGGTDINTAVGAALKQREPGETNYVVFLTDGNPTVGETNEEKILKRLTDETHALEKTPTRLFVFGAGYDVNTHFLDKLAQNNGGLSTYVRPSEDIEVKVSSFFAKIAQPVLADLSMNWGKAATYDVFPRELPDLFHGSQVEVFGRYKATSAGRVNLCLTGTAPEGSRSFELAADLPEEKTGTDYIAALWAARKIGYLLDQIRLNGEKKELVEEVVRLSLEYGILTEYTAFLAREGRALTPAEAADRTRETFRAAAAPGPAGGWAVSQSQNAQQMQAATQMGAANTYVDEKGEVQRIANIQNVGQRGYVLREGRWEDTRYQPQQQVALRVQAFSEAHFQLSRTFPVLNSQLGVGDRALLLLNGQLIEVGAEGKTRLTDADLESLREGRAPAEGVSAVPGPLAWLLGRLAAMLA